MVVELYMVANTPHTATTGTPNNTALNYTGGRPAVIAILVRGCHTGPPSNKHYLSLLLQQHQYWLGWVQPLYKERSDVESRAAMDVTYIHIWIYGVFQL